MKLKKLKLENFGKFVKFEIEFDGNITHLVGINGAGKTTVGLTAIWACLMGIAERKKNGQLTGERFRFIGPNKSTAKLELTLIDEAKKAEIKIKNRISKAGNQITFEAPFDYQINDEWLKNLLSVSLLSAKNFTQVNSKEQALLLGIDTEKHDKSIAELKTDYTILNREYKSFGDLLSGTKVERVDVTELIKQKDTIDAFNRKQQDAKTSILDANSLLSILEEKKNKLLAEVKNVDNQIKINNDILSKLKPEAEKSTKDILGQINKSQETNDLAAKYEQAEKKKKEKAVKNKQLEKNKADQEKKVNERLDYIKSFKFPFDGLSVDENGGLLLNDRPIKEAYFSKGELELIVAKLYASLNPEFKVRFIDDFELLDEDNQKKIVDELLAGGFQIITAEVRDRGDGENVIYLRECKRVDKEGKSEKLI